MNYRIEWTESTRYSVNIKAPGIEELREIFWWYVHDGTLHDYSVEVDGGSEPQNVVIAEDRDNRTADFTYKEYLEAQ